MNLTKLDCMFRKFRFEALKPECSESRVLRSAREALKHQRSFEARVFRSVSEALKPSEALKLHSRSV